MSVFFVAMATVFSFSRGAELCKCSKISDFQTTANAVFSDAKKADRYVLVDAEVMSVPEKDPKFGYMLTNEVVLNILGVETPGQTVPENVVLSFIFAGNCDPNTKLFTKDKRYLMLLERTGDDETPFKYPGTACKIGMQELSGDRAPASLPTVQ